MGTHPIFESDFDCLTELKSVMSSVAPKVALTPRVLRSNYPKWWKSQATIQPDMENCNPMVSNFGNNMWIGACYYDTSRVPSDLFNNDELVGCSGAKSYDRVQDEELLTALLCISKEVQSNPAFLKDQPELVELMRDAFIKGHLVPNGKKRVPGIAEIGDLSISADSEAMFGCITGFTKEGSGVKGESVSWILTSKPINGSACRTCSPASSLALCSSRFTNMFPETGRTLLMFYKIIAH